MFLFAAGFVIAVRRCRYAGNVCGEIPLICCALASCFSSWPHEVPGPVCYKVLPRRNDTGEYWVHRPVISLTSRTTTLQSREKDGYKNTERCYTQNCARIADVWPGGTSQNCCVGIFLSTDDRWCKGSVWCPASGASYVCLSSCVLIVGV